MPKEILVLGQGNVLTATTIFKGLPGICLCDAPAGSTGEPGQPGPEHERHMQEHGTLILFSNMASALRLVERIKESIEQMVIQSNQENQG